MEPTMLERTLKFIFDCVIVPAAVLALAYFIVLAGTVIGMMIQG